MAVKKPWEKPMPAAQFKLLSEIIGAPSPIGLEAAMSYGVIKPIFEKIKLRGWKAHQYKGNAGLVFDTAPTKTEALSVMVVGHADKIRLQVRSIDKDGKVWLNSDSFLPQTLVGHEVILFCKDPKDPKKMKRIEGGTIEAIGAIHFAPPDMRSGAKGIKPEMLYLELQQTGEKRKEHLEKIGIRPGDTVLLKRPIQRGFGKNSFYGAYLDNGIGCFVVTELLKMLAADKGLKNVRFLGAIASHEEIGRFGSRVLAGDLKPDVLIAVDVAHDYDAAPGVSDKRYTPATMGGGFTIATGATVSEHLNRLLASVADKQKIPYQIATVGRDTGTDGMAAVLASIDSAMTSLGCPVRNMHTASECGHTSDIIGCTHALFHLLKMMDKMNKGKGMNRSDLCNGHPRLDHA